MSSELSGTREFTSGSSSFLVGTRPQDALAEPFETALELLRRRFGPSLDEAVSPEAVDLDVRLEDLPAPALSPRRHEPDSSWMRRANMIGINLRTVSDFAGVLKYSLTLPASIDSIHLLPIWEPGVVESLYGIASWNLNEEFFSPEMRASLPHLDSTAAQLRATTNVLHLLGKTVGMDVIPHTDRYSEAAVANPNLFEWMVVAGDTIIDHSDGVVHQVEQQVLDWLTEVGAAVADLTTPGRVEDLFGLPEAERLRLLFGEPEEAQGRRDRRIALVRALKHHGFEPVPATMGVPFRGLEVVPDRTVVDDFGMSWHEFRMVEPGPEGRVFSPLARFKLYESQDDNADWEIDFSQPRHHVWEYVQRHYAAARHIGNFDFMRGDMSHVQMRPAGVPEVIDSHYEILGSVKTHIQEETDSPWFGYFAESFLPPRDVFGFGEELDHLAISRADATLGDLQSTSVGSPEFLSRFRRYLDDLETRPTAPAFCIGTSDKDDPRFDEYYRAGNEARVFTSLFLTDMPSYTSLGFEIRDVHESPVENERYTKLFVFAERGSSNVYPSKARHSDTYVWGENHDLFEAVNRIRHYAEGVLEDIGASATRWLIPPDATGLRGTAAWTHESGERVFVVNYDTNTNTGLFGLPGLGPAELRLEFSTSADSLASNELLSSNDFFHRVEDLGPGEGRVYRVI